MRRWIRSGQSNLLWGRSALRVPAYSSNYSLKAEDRRALDDNLGLGGNRVARLNRRNIFKFFPVLLVVLMAIAVFEISPVGAAMYTIDNNKTINGSYDFSTLDVSSPGQMKLQSGDVGKWNGQDGMVEPPVLTYGDSDSVVGPDGKLYLVTEYRNDSYFIRYDNEIRKWEFLDTPSAKLGYRGVAVASDGVKYIYCLPGGSLNSFFRYDITTNSWSKMADLPVTSDVGSDITFATSGGSSYIYAFRGNSSNTLWQYNISANSWTQKASFPASVYSWGVNIVWDGSDGIFAISNNYNGFYKYSISANTWGTALATPGTPAAWHSQMKTGSNEIIDFRRDYVSTGVTRLRKYTIDTNTWSDLATPPIGGYSDGYWYTQAASFDGSDTIYAQAGGGAKPVIMRYTLSTNSWNTTYNLFPLMGRDLAHGDLVYDGNDAVYFTTGENAGSYPYGNYLYKMTISTGVTTQLGVHPILGQIGWKGVYKDNALYMMPFAGTYFYKFDIATSSWNQLADLPYTATTGLGIVDGGDGYLYANMGGRANFHRYKVADNTWENLSSMSYATGAGGYISAKIGTDIYAIPGGTYPFLLKYSTTDNSWTTLNTKLPNGVASYGATLASDSARYLYFTTGYRTDEQGRIFFRFDTLNNTWKRLADLPSAATIWASSFYDTTQSRVYLSPGRDYHYLWYWTPSTDTYVQSANWISEVYDLTQVESWTNFSADVAGTGTVNFYTRVSDNGKIWTAWTLVSGGNIQSNPPKRYLQLKLSLSGDTTATPTVSNIQFNYAQETAAPTLPSQLTAKSKQTDGVDIVSGNTYEYQHPYFGWSGASDGASGSGVDGYYVYYGTDGSADPETAGNYQTTSSYVVSTPMTSYTVYYLRIKVKDKLGNISSTQTYFSYRYWYISPPGNVSYASKADFETGSNTNLDLTTSSGDMNLVKNSLGAWGVGSFTAMPDYAYSPAAVIAGDNLYILKGNGSTVFWKYERESQTWATLATPPAAVSTGSSMAWDGDDSIYALRGNNTNSLYKYSIRDNQWTTQGSAPIAAQNGSAIAYIGNNKLMLMVSGTTDFYEYDVSLDTWTSKAGLPSVISTTYGGSGMWYDGTDNLYIYLGIYSSSDYDRRMYKYTISSDSWRMLSDPPSRYLYMQNDLVSDGLGNLYIFGQDYFFQNTFAGQKYNIATDSWTKLDSYTTSTRGTIASDGKRYIYIITNKSEGRQIVQYDTWNDRYQPSGYQPSQLRYLRNSATGDQAGYLAGTASSATYDGTEYVYMVGGDEGYSGQFLRYSLTTNQTEYMLPPPMVGRSGAIAYSNGYIYYATAYNSVEFYRYNIRTKWWERLEDAPATLRYLGQAMTVDSSGNLYLPRGNNTNTFYKYTPGVGWSTLNNIPTTDSEGGAVYDGSRYIYLLSGTGTGFYQYDTSLGSWATKAVFPVSCDYGCDMVLENGKIYATSGNVRTTSYIYDIADNSWSAGAAIPEPFTFGSFFLRIDSTHALASAGDNHDQIWRFNFPATDKAYGGLGVHISPSIQVDGMFDYAGIQASVNLPANTDIEFYTRTSTDNTTWSDWTFTSQMKKSLSQMSSKVESAPQKYIQIKAILYSYDNISTPTLLSYQVDYYSDTVQPENPSVLHVYTDSSKTTELDNNTWYNYANAYFDWPDPGGVGGATDGEFGSRIKGYYVYLGTDETATPQGVGTFVTSSDFTANLTTSAIYYFRLQAVDNTNNVKADVFAPFVYKFDNTPPDNPPFISVNPSGYTATNDYSFGWPTASDDHSGVALYCYKTGATTGIYSVEQCQTERTLSHLQVAYRQGTNVFYLRTKDVAENFSTSYLEASFYYSTDPPNPVTDLRAIPPVSSQNMFAFVWDLPAFYSGDENQLDYCYSINELPTALNTTCVTDRYLAPFKAGTQMGTNIIYVVAKDEAGSVNWNNYASANFIANTISPGIPVNLLVTDSSDRSANRWSITLTWTKPTFEGNGVDHYIIERSTDQHTFAQIGTVSSTAYVDMAIVEETTYYYRIKAADNVDNVGGASAIVEGQARGSYDAPPAIVSAPQIMTGFDQAEISWVTEREATSFVNYGLSPTKLENSRGSLTLATTHSITITGLTPQTTYYLKVQSFDLDRTYELDQAFSQLYSFRTGETGRIESVSTSDETVQTIVIKWTSSIATKSKVEYGKTTGYGLAFDENAGYGTDHTVKLEGLEGGAIYHFRIVGTTESSSQIVSDDYTFQTVDYPTISNIKFQPDPEAVVISAKVLWTTNVPTDSSVTYRIDSKSLEVAKSDLETNHTAALSGLAGNAQYIVTIKGRDKYGNQVISEEQRWKSQIDTRAPKVTNLTVDTTTVGFGTGSRAQAIVSWNTDEPSASFVKYGLGIGANSKLDKETPKDTSFNTSHVVVMSNLDLSQLYRLQPISIDQSGNTAYGEETIAITPKKESSILDIIIGAFEGLGGRLGW